MTPARLLVGPAVVAVLATGVAGGATAAEGAAPHAGNDTLVTEPDQGYQPIYDFIGSATRSIDMTMYELTDTTAESDLAAAAAKGVTVRVILDTNREKSRNTTAYNYLNAHGVQAVWADPTYAATHQKTITVDGTRSAVLTGNLPAVTTRPGGTRRGAAWTSRSS